MPLSLSSSLSFELGIFGKSAVLRRHFLVTASQAKASHFFLKPSSSHLVQRIPPALAVWQSYPSLVKTLMLALLTSSSRFAVSNAELDGETIALREIKPREAINRVGIFIIFSEINYEPHYYTSGFAHADRDAKFEGWTGTAKIVQINPTQNTKIRILLKTVERLSLKAAANSKFGGLRLTRLIF